MRRTQLFWAVLGVLTVSVAFFGCGVSQSPTGLAGATRAKGGGKPGGGTDPTGTIYLWNASWGQLWTMDANGDQKQVLLDFYPSPAEPSHDTHGGGRWFLHVKNIDGGTPYPDGDPQRGWFAVDETGNSVPLITQADLEPWGEPGGGAVRWTRPDSDAAVSFIALRWNLATGQAVEAGLYTAQVAFDPATGAVTGIEAGSVDLLVPANIVQDSNGERRPSMGTHDWAPEGTAIVYDTTTDYVTTPDELYVVDLSSTDPPRLLTSERAARPVWSPDGTKIAFDLIWPQGGGSDLATIRPDGSDLQVIIRSHAGKFRIYAGPRWSPTGSHLGYHGFGGLSAPSDIYRATGDGGGKTNLTRDIDDDVRPLAWR